MSDEKVFKTIIEGTLNKVPGISLSVHDGVEDCFISGLLRLYHYHDKNVVTWFLCNWLLNEDEMTLLAKHLIAVSTVSQALNIEHTKDLIKYQMSTLMSVVRNKVSYIEKYYECFKTPGNEYLPAIRVKVGAPKKFHERKLRVACLRPFLRRRFGSGTDTYLTTEESVCHLTHDNPYIVYLPTCYSRECVNDVKYLLSERRIALLPLCTSEVILKYCVDATKAGMTTAFIILTLQLHGKHIHKYFLSVADVADGASDLYIRIKNQRNPRNYIELLDECYENAVKAGIRPTVFIDRNYSEDQLALLLRALKKGVLIDTLLDEGLKPSYMSTLITVLSMRKSQGY